MAVPYLRAAVARLLVAGGVAVAATVGPAPAPAEAASPFLVTPDPAVAIQTPAYRYANMTDAEAYAELDRRQILHTRLGLVAGVRAPVRLTGRLHGVWFHSSLSPEDRVKSPFEILDARLALALDDFASILARHDIDEVVHFTMYRPNAGAPDGVHDHDEQAAPLVAKRNHHVRTLAARSKRGAKPAGATTGKRDAKPTAGARGKAGKGLGDKAAKRETPIKSGAKQKPSSGPKTPVKKPTWAPPGTRHPAGLAIDVGGLRKRDGRWLSVGSHFQGKIGEKTCGAGARLPESPEARELRSIVCEAADLGVFTYVLTPNYNAAHVDHYHMEIKPGVQWFLYH